MSGLAETLSQVIDKGELAGLVALTWRGEELIEEIVIGWADIAQSRPMARDTIFRIASQTKPIISVAAMMLVEDGLLGLQDPVENWLPELRGPPVLRHPNGALIDTVAARRAITLDDLLTHRAGLDYGLFSIGPIAKAYRETLSNFTGGPDEWAAALGALPLVYQPGERMHYSVATDALGVLVARVADRPLADFLAERVFAPLDMEDTSFFVAAAERDRLAKLYAHDGGPVGLVEVAMPVPDEAPLFPSGGAGLLSTADDYLSFARMLLGEGALNGRRLLQTDTVRAMLTNRLTTEQRAIPFIGSPTWKGSGFGLGLAIVDDPEHNQFGIGRCGSFTWPGAFGTWWQADPAEALVMVYMTQHYIEPNAAMGQAIASAAGAGRRGLQIYQRATYEALDR